tara:strand:- start:1904 stop:2197 length:294 start_codon:yes stop_codon:yes gene_type:complete
MKIINLLIILLFFYSTNSFSVEKDCSTIDKLSKEYAKCIADLAKEKGKKVKEAAKKKSKEVKDKVATDENKKKFSKFKSKLKKFKESKTGSEFLKKE